MGGVPPIGPRRLTGGAGEGVHILESTGVAAVITAVGIALASVFTSFAALRNAKYSAGRVEDLEHSLIDMQLTNTRLLAEIEILKKSKRSWL
jgi:hypothetical protein